MKSDELPYLSVVATTRNDDHGKNLLYRMQTFVDGFIEQCKRHNLKAELILVEWNPPENSLPLAQALCFPPDKGPCSVRIIQVSKEIHLKLDHSDKIPLFQMIAKNVGIRRARGKFILATNIDVLFSDNLMSFIKRKLSDGHLYRVDRLDVPEKLPETSAFNEILHYCSKNYFRINGKFGTFIVQKVTFKDKLNRWFRRISNCIIFIFKTLVNISLKTLFTQIIPSIYSFITHNLINIVYVKIASRIKKILCCIFPRNSLFIHSNACGDFTLLSFDNWAQLKGYPEWNIFSWHIDSILLYQAKQHGIKEYDLPIKFPIYHIDHETGSGYSPEGANLLFKRLHDKGIPYLTEDAFKDRISDMKQSNEKVVYNNDDWGMANLALEEFIV